MPTSTRNKVETGLRRGSAARIVGRRGGEERAFNFFSIRERKRSIFQGNKEERRKGLVRSQFFLFRVFSTFSTFLFFSLLRARRSLRGKNKAKRTVPSVLRNGGSDGRQDQGDCNLVSDRILFLSVCSVEKKGYTVRRR